MDQEEMRSYYERVSEEQHHKYIQLDDLQEHQNCSCSICQKIDQKKYCCKQEINNITANIISIDTHSRDRDYIFLIKRLQPPQLRCLRFNIPDVCTFNAQGEMEFLFSQSRNGKQFRYIKSKRMPLLKVKRIFIEKRPTKTETSFESFQKTQKSKENLFLSSKMIIRRDKKESFERNLERAIQETAICKYDDDNVQVLSEGEFSQLMGKRKSDQIFSQILYLQSFVKSVKYFRIKFCEKDVDTPLFQRAELEIKIIIKDIVTASSDYITEDMEALYESTLSDEELARYLSYKIVHFIGKISQQKITQGIFEWVYDSKKEIFFIGASNIIHAEILQSQFRNRQKYQDLNSMMDKYQINDQVVQAYTQIMSNEYRRKKEELGFDEKAFIINKDKETEQIFNELHKDSRLGFNETFKNTESYHKNEGISNSSSQASLLNYLRSQHSQSRSKSRKIITQPTPLNIPNTAARPRTSFQRPSYNRLRASNSLHVKPPLKQNTLPYLLSF